MKTGNEKILDSYIRHQTYLLRYAGGLRNKSLPILAETEKSLYDSIVKWATKAETNRKLVGATGRKWQRDFEKAINDIRKPAWDEIAKQVQAEFRELVIMEAATGAAIIEGSIPVVIGMALPPTDKLIAIVNSQPFQGKTLAQWLKSTRNADVQRMLSYAKVGIVQGRTPTQIARGVIGSKAAKHRGSIARKAFRDLESVLLTLTNGVQNEAKQALYAANSDIVQKELYVATLDVRTTIECAALDGKVFPQGDGPVPPLHFRCRSLRVPYINPDTLRNRGFDSRTEGELTREYAKENGLGDIKKRENLPRGHKGKFDQYARKQKKGLVGQVPAQTTYNNWLKRQSVPFQDQVLGRTRAKMFREGKVSLDKFVARDGDVLTLDELRRKGLEVPD